jgi:hypothetical protein
MRLYQSGNKNQLVDLVCLVCLVDLVHLVSSFNQKPNRPNEQDKLADFFNIQLMWLTIQSTVLYDAGETATQGEGLYGRTV